MFQIFIAVIVALLVLLEPAASQLSPEACANATTANATMCNGTLLCNETCVNLTKTIIYTCPSQVAVAQRMAFLNTCPDANVTLPNVTTSTNGTITPPNNGTNGTTPSVDCQRSVNALLAIPRCSNITNPAKLNETDCPDCRTPLENVVARCGDNNQYGITQARINAVCGTTGGGGGGGASTLSTVGIYTVLLLFAVIAALVF